MERIVDGASEAERRLIIKFLMNYSQAYAASDVLQGTPSWDVARDLSFDIKKGYHRNPNYFKELAEELEETWVIE